MITSLLTGLLAGFLTIDQWLFLRINQGFTHPVLDTVLLFVSDLHRIKWLTITLVLVFILSCVKKYRKAFWKPVLFMILSASLSDLICYRLVKSTFHRDRPFQSESFGEQVRKIGHAHGTSFPSNHASNSFAGAYALSYIFPNLSYFFYFYAALVAISRVYVGVHYPFDVAFGSILGLFVAFAIRRVFKNQFNSFTGPKS